MTQPPLWDAALQALGLQDLADERGVALRGWTKTFTDPRLCAAIVDRLTFGGNIIKTGITSYRLAHARAQRAGHAAGR